MVRDIPLHNFFFQTDETGLYQNLSTWCTPWIDVCCLLRLVAFHKPRTLLEIGTHKGYTTRIVAERFPALQITTVDPGDAVAPAQRPANQAGEYLPQDQIGMLVAGRPNVQIIKQAFESIDFGAQRFDFIFVDGDHRFDAVVRDTRKALGLLGRPGVIAWHDFNNVKEVNAALEQFRLEPPIAAIHNTWVAYHVQR